MRVCRLLEGLPFLEQRETCTGILRDHIPRRQLVDRAFLDGLRKKVDGLRSSASQRHIPRVQIVRFAGLITDYAVRHRLPLAFVLCTAAEN